MEKIIKNVHLLYILEGNNVLMRKFKHQDYEVIDVFPISNTGDIDVDIKNKLMGLFGKNFPYVYYGNIESVIYKQEVIARLHIQTYKILLDQKYNILENYSDDMVDSGNAVFWLNQNEISNEKRLREGDKKILERVFSDKKINIKIIENQGGKWIDAKTVVFEDS